MLSYEINPELRCLYSLLNITEEMLFSIPLKIQLVQKYELMRETALKKLNLPSDSSHIWKLQQQAHSSAEAKTKEKLDDKSNEELLINKIKASHESTKNYADLAIRSILAIEAHYSETSQLLGFQRGSRPKLVFAENEIPSFTKTKVLTEFLDRCQEIEFSESSCFAKLQKLFSAEEDNLNLLNEKISQIIEEQRENSRFNQEQYLNEKLQKEAAVQQIEFLKQKCQEIETNYEIIIEEAKLNHEKSEFELRNNYSTEIKELKSKLNESSKYTQEIEQVKSQCKQEIAEIHKLYENKMEDLNNSINHQTSFHKQKIQELELSFHGRETQLLIELDKLQTEDSSVLRNLRENVERLQTKVQDLRDVLKAVCERTNPLFDRFAGKEDIAEDFARRKEELSDFAENDSWEHYSELLTELEFIGYAFSKMSTDNDWLIDRLDECSKENEDLRQVPQKVPEVRSSAFEEVLSSLSANKLVLRDFQEARSKLMNHFSDAKGHNLSGIS